MRTVSALVAFIICVVALCVPTAASAATNSATAACTNWVRTAMGNLTEADARRLQLGTSIPLPDGSTRKLEPRGAHVWGLCEQFVDAGGVSVSSRAPANPAVVATATPLPQAAVVAPAPEALKQPAPPVAATAAVAEVSEPKVVYGTKRSLWQRVQDTAGTAWTNSLKWAKGLGTWFGEQNAILRWTGIVVGVGIGIFIVLSCLSTFMPNHYEKWFPWLIIDDEEETPPQATVFDPTADDEFAAANERHSPYPPEDPLTVNRTVGAG